MARLGRRQPNRPIAYSPSTSTKYAPAGGITEHGSAPAPVLATGISTTATTASFTPVANSLLVAIACGGGGTAVQTVPVTDSLGSTWTLLKRANTNNFAGVTEIWVMDAGSSPSARTVTATLTGSDGAGISLCVKVLTGAQPAATCLGGFTVLHTTTAYTISITTTTAGSLACAGLVDSTASGVLTANGITTAWQSENDGTDGHKLAAFRATSLTGTPGATVIGFTNGAANNQAIVAVEILAATGGTPISLADAGAGTDSIAATAIVPVADSGAGADTIGAVATAPLADVGSASDAVAVTVPIGIADSGSGSDTALVGFGIAVADSGAGSDALTVSAAVPVSDSGSAADAAAVTAAVPIADAGSAADARVATATVPLTDAGSGSDAVAAGVPISVADTGAGTDSLTLAVTVPLADTGSGSDARTATATVPLTDTASAAEQAALTVLLALADAGTAADALAVSRTVPVADAGSGADSVSVQ
ncbi:MAG TPA: hypothetical protein VFE14_04660, partial [Micromonosporaceae bacterium]|nr:hypothetical protein [Micromonosporaceae bacterium]